MEIQKLGVWIKRVLTALVVVLVFAATLLILCEPVENVAFTTVTVYLSAFVCIMGFAWFSYRHRLDMRILFVALVVLLILRYFVLDSGGLLVLILSNISLGGAYGLSLLLLGGVLSFTPFKEVRPTILLGVAGSALLFPLIYSRSAITAGTFQEILFLLIPAVLLVFSLVEKGARSSFAPALATFEKQGNPKKRWRDILFAQDRSSTIAFAMTVPFFFCLGTFRGYSLAHGWVTISSDAIMFGIAVVLVSLFVVNRIRSSKSNTWFIMICFACEGLYMAIIFSTMMVPDFPLFLFGIMRALMAILQVWVLVLLSEVSVKRAISPVFLYGAFAIICFLPHILGDLFASFLLSGSSPNVGFVLVGGALMTIAIAASILVVALTRSKAFELTEASAKKHLGASGKDTVAQGQEALEWKADDLAAFCQNNGLSEKESEVILFYSQGRSVRYISSKLYLSESTVRTYIQRVYSKLDIHNRQALLDAIDSSIEVSPEV